jgi:hypothetical protein
MPPDGRWGGGPATAPKSRPWGNKPGGAKRSGGGAAGNQGIGTGGLNECGVKAKDGDGGEEGRGLGSPSLEAKRDSSDRSHSSEVKAVVATLSSLNFSDVQWSAARASFLERHKDAEVAAAVAADFDRERGLQSASASTPLPAHPGSRGGSGGGGGSGGSDHQKSAHTPQDDVAAAASRAGAGSPTYEGEEEFELERIGEDEVVEVAVEGEEEEEEEEDWAEDVAVAAASAAGDSPTHAPSSTQSKSLHTDAASERRVGGFSGVSSRAVVIVMEERQRQCNAACESEYDVGLQKLGEEAAAAAAEEAAAAAARRRRAPSHVTGRDRCVVHFIAMQAESKPPRLLTYITTIPITLRCGDSNVIYIAIPKPLTLNPNT